MRKRIRKHYLRKCINIEKSSQIILKRISSSSSYCSVLKGRESSSTSEMPNDFMNITRLPRRGLVAIDIALDLKVIPRDPMIKSPKSWDRVDSLQNYSNQTRIIWRKFD